MNHRFPVALNIMRFYMCKHEDQTCGAMNLRVNSKCVTEIVSGKILTEFSPEVLAYKENGERRGYVLRIMCESVARQFLWMDSRAYVF